jgi:hypothetical protein
MRQIKETGNRKQEKGEHVRARMTARSRGAKFLPIYFSLLPSAARRQATTLIEVLMSIMILSIGIISLATLFPASVIRSLQATQLTNAAILVSNVEAALDVLPPAFVFDPNRDPNTEPFVPHVNESYYVDPLGFALAPDDPNDPTRNSLGGLSRYRGLQLFDPNVNPNGAAGAVAAARDFVTLPDSWITDYEGVPQNVAGNRESVVLLAEDVPGVIDLNQLQGTINSGVKVRAVLTGIDGRSSQVRLLSQNDIDPANRTLSWLGAALPDNGNYDPLLGAIRIQKQEIRYTWLLTIRNNGGVANIDVVVFFRRPDPPTGETRHQAVFTGPTTSPSMPGSRTATINWTTTERPALKKGSFILDADNALWYRIEDILSETSNAATIQLDRPAVRDGTKAVVMEGVVEVFRRNDRVP